MKKQITLKVSNARQRRAGQRYDAVGLAERIRILFDVFGSSHTRSVSPTSIHQGTGLPLMTIYRLSRTAPLNPRFKTLKALLDYFGVSWTYFDCRTPEESASYLQAIQGAGGAKFLADGLAEFGLSEPAKNQVASLLTFLWSEERQRATAPKRKRLRRMLIADQLKLLFDFFRQTGRKSIRIEDIRERTGLTGLTMHSFRSPRFNPHFETMRALVRYFDIRWAYFDCATPDECLAFLHILQEGAPARALTDGLRGFGLSGPAAAVVTNFVAYLWHRESRKGSAK